MSIDAGNSRFEITYKGSGFQDTYNPASNPVVNSWFYDCATFDDTNSEAKFYVNGSKVWNQSNMRANILDFAYCTNAYLHLGSQYVDAYYYYGKLQRFTYWGRILNDSDISLLYNQSGYPYQQVIIPEIPDISLGIKSSLVNNTNTTNPNVLISYNGTIKNTTDIFNCTLLNNLTALNVSNDVNLSVNNFFNYSFETEGFYYFNINCSNYAIQNKTGLFKYSYTIPSTPSTPTNYSRIEMLLNSTYLEVKKLNNGINMIEIIFLDLGFWLLMYYLFRKGFFIPGIMVGITGFGIDFIMISLGIEFLTITNAFAAPFFYIGTLIFYYTLPISRASTMLLMGLRR